MTAFVALYLAVLSLVGTLAYGVSQEGVRYGPTSVYPGGCRVRVESYRTWYMETVSTTSMECATPEGWKP